MKDKSKTEGHNTHFVLASHVRHPPVLPSQLVADAVDGLVLHVDGSDQQVVGNVVQVTTELEPGAGGTDVVCGALTFHLGREGGGQSTCTSSSEE